MSEFLNNENPQIEAVYNYAKRLINRENGRLLYQDYHEAIEKVSASETMWVFHKLLNEGIDFSLVKSNVGKILNSLFKQLNSKDWDVPTGNHFIALLMEENRRLESLLDEIKGSFKDLILSKENVDQKLILQLQRGIAKLKGFDLHYLKKEHILFPYIETTMPNFACVRLMWSFHDDFRRLIVTIESNLKEINPNLNELNTNVGKLFFVVKPILFREEHILFPEVIKHIPPKSFEEMLLQSKDIGWCFEVNPIYDSLSKEVDFQQGFVNLETGFLKPSEIILMLENLPVDITYVDDNDEVRYFSGAKHRIFPRTNAIIGRKVQNCHPAESVHIVNEIIDAFKKHEKNTAEFWIQMRDKFIHIRYYALYDAENVYKGTIEVSQDVTEIRALKGERRLLEWGI